MCDWRSGEEGGAGERKKKKIVVDGTTILKRCKFWQKL